LRVKGRRNLVGEREDNPIVNYHEKGLGRGGGEVLWRENQGPNESSLMPGKSSGLGMKERKHFREGVSQISWGWKGRNKTTSEWEELHIPRNKPLPRLHLTHFGRGRDKRETRRKERTHLLGRSEV